MTRLQQFLYVLLRDHRGVSLNRILDVLEMARGDDADLLAQARALARRLSPTPSPAPSAYVPEAAIDHATSSADTTEPQEPTP